MAGTDVGTLSEGQLAKWRSRNVGFIFQFYNLIPVLTAVENVELPLLLTRLSKKQRRERALTALKVVGLADRYKHYPRQLSGGQEQRVAIARAIVADPAVLVADEPTGDLDAKSAEEILNLLQTLNREFKKTIVMVTHDPARGRARAHRAAPREGRARALGHAARSRGDGEGMTPVVRYPLPVPCSPQPLALSPGPEAMKYLPYILKHLRKNWIRTLSTILAMALCIFLIGTLQTLLRAFYGGMDRTSTERLVMRNRVSLVFSLPLSYEPRLAACRASSGWRRSNWFGGGVPTATGAPDMKNFFPNFAVEAEPYLAMFPEYGLTDAGEAAFLHDRRGAIDRPRSRREVRVEGRVRFPAREHHSAVPRRHARSSSS